MSLDDFALTSPVPVGGRESHDHFPTPRSATLALISAGDWASTRSVLDPSCGEGSILDVFREQGFETLGLELDPARAEAARLRGHKTGVGDALERSWPSAKACVMNPPYSHAEAFVQKALDWRRENIGWPPIYALLRLSFLEPTKSRRHMLVGYNPDVLILPRRLSFDGKGHDNITSAWFCWPGNGHHQWLPP